MAHDAHEYYISRMKLHGSLTSPFVRKVRVAFDEKGLPYSFIPENPRLAGSRAEHLVPLRKVPLLELDDGGVLYDSRVIVEYLETLGGTPLVPAEGAARWTALRLQALADGLGESVIKVWQERKLAEAERRADFLAWEERRVERVLDALDKEPRAGAHFTAELGIADIAVAVMLEYVDRRLELAWRTRWPALAEWLAPLSRRASFVRTAHTDTAA
jgi:glutathione S-transferase